MNERRHMDADPIYKDVAAWLAGACVATVAWVGKRTIGHVERLDEKKADKVDLSGLIDELREDRKAADVSRQELHEKVNTVALTVARLEGRLGPRA